MNAQTDVTVAALGEAGHDALRRGVGSDRAGRAAIELVAETGWTSGERGLHLLGAHTQATGDPQARTLDWHSVVRHIHTASDTLPATDSELRVLRVAASLAGGGPVDLREVLQGLTPAHRRAVRRALRRATNHDDVLVPAGPELQRRQHLWDIAALIWYGALIGLLWCFKEAAQAGQATYATGPRLAYVVAFGAFTLVLCERSLAVHKLPGWTWRRAAGNVAAIAILTFLVMVGLLAVTAPLARLGMIAGVPVALSPIVTAILVWTHRRPLHRGAGSTRR